MQILTRAIQSELGRISNKAGGRKLGQHLEAGRDLDNVVDCYRRIQHYLERLSVSLIRLVGEAH